MKHILTFFLLIAVSANSFSQVFDSTAYKKVYKENFENHFFEDSLSTETKIAGLSKAWAEAKFNFANFDLVPKVNWDSLYYAYIPKVTAAQNKVDYYRELSRFYLNLNDGHSGIIPPKELWDKMVSRLPIRAKLLDGQVVITALNSQKEEYRDLQPKTIITRVNGIPVMEYTQKNVAPYVNYSTPHDQTARLYSFFFTQGDADEPIELEFITPEGRKKIHSFRRETRDEMFPAAQGWTYRKMAEGTALLTINTYNDNKIVAFLDSIFQKVPHAQNLIIDVRNNGGGNGSNGFELLGYLTDKPFLTGKNMMRSYGPTNRAWGNDPDKLETMQYDWKPYKGHTFTGKVVVLTGPDTYSAAEDFTAAFKGMERGVVMGQTTGGSTGQPLFFPLPFGGMGVVCSKRDLMPDGTEFVGIGIKPDIEVVPTLENYLAGKDETLEAALKYLQQ